MAYAAEMVKGGITAGQAKAIGGAYADIVATGSAQTDAATLTASMCVVTAADGTKGVILTGDVGDEVWVFNSAGSTLKVYPDVGAAIDVTGTGLGTVNAAYSQLTLKVALYKKVKTTQWFVVVT